MSRRADQLLAGFADGDAISHEAVALRDILRKTGRASDIFADPNFVSPTLRGEFRPLSDYAGGSGDIAIHHYSIGSQALDLFSVTAAKKIMIYHNITPPEFFDGFDDRVAAQLRSARASLPQIGAKAAAIWADSAFGTSPLCLVIGLLLGCVAATASTIALVRRYL